jgi:hypothetical protein
MALTLCCVAILAATLRAQGDPVQADQDALKSFSDSIHKHKLIPLGLSADPEVDYRWLDVGLAVTNPKVHTLGIFEPDSVRLKDGRVRIEGHRRTLIRDEKGAYAASGEGTSVTLVVDLSGTDPAVALPQLKSRLFYPSVEEALTRIPPSYREMLPYTLKPDHRPDPKQKESAKELLDACGPDAKKADYVPPKMVEMGDPPELRGAVRKGQGESALAVTIDASGHLRDIWIAESSSPSLDSDALDRFERSRFAPATCRGVVTDVHAIFRLKLDAF